MAAFAAVAMLSAAQAAPPPYNPGNPFQAILDKLDQVLTAITSTGGVGSGNHTLRWDQNLPAAQRFVILAAFSSAAVLDKNTGLVWEQAPDATLKSWSNATLSCIRKVVPAPPALAGTRGWRLPSVVELASLVSPDNSNPALPTGHPFSNDQLNLYWSATTVADSPTVAWAVDVSNGLTGGVAKEVDFFRAWCVRGGANVDAY